MQIKIKYNHFNAKSEDVMTWKRELDEKSKWVVAVQNIHVLYRHLCHHKVQAFNMMMK